MATIVSSVSEENGTRYVRVRLEEFQRLASSCNIWQNRARWFEDAFQWAVGMGLIVLAAAIVGWMR